MHISYSSCAKATTNVLSSVFLYLVIDWKGNGVFGKDKASTPTLTVSFTLCHYSYNSQWYEPSLVFTLPFGRKCKKGSQVLRFWRFMPKGEKVLSPKQKDRTTISKFSKISISFDFWLKWIFKWYVKRISQLVSSKLHIKYERTSITPRLDHWNWIPF
jgi:hypothetical protein